MSVVDVKINKEKKAIYEREKKVNKTFTLLTICGDKCQWEGKKLRTLPEMFTVRYKHKHSNFSSDFSIAHELLSLTKAKMCLSCVISRNMHNMLYKHGKLLLREEKKKT